MDDVIPEEQTPKISERYKNISMKFARHIFRSNTRSKFLTYPDNIERKVAEGVDSHNNHQHLDQLKQRSRVNI